MLCTRVYNYFSKSSLITSKLAYCSVKPSVHLIHQEPKLIFKMNEAFLRHEKETDTFDISFRFINTERKVDRQFNFSRKINSTIENFLSRIDNSIGKALNAKVKRKKNAKDSLPENALLECKAILMLNGSPVDGDVLCETLFKDKADISLCISGTKYAIKYNAPWVSNIALAKCILAGFPTYPTKFESFNTSQAESKFTWFRNTKSIPNADEWQQVSQGFLYTPEVPDIGCILKLQCLPEKDGKIGPVVEVKSSSPVEAGPGRCPFETRHLFTSNKLNGQCFRVTSYNILADLYTDSAYSRDVLFPYCPPYALDIDYRKYLIMKELLGFNSDIICLQEVDNKIFDYDLHPTLSTLNYNGVFNRKGGSVSEGLSTFFNNKRFQKLGFESAVLGENVHLDGFSHIWEGITNEQMKERFLCRSTAIQATALLSRDNPREILVVGNTHLYFHPNADHIRLLQGYYALTYVRNIANDVKAKYPNHNVSIILCGDFNSVPDCGIYQLMLQNHIPEDYKDWNSNPEEAITDVQLSHDLSFASACGTPQYTNFTTGFADCLDYIFYQTDRLEVEQVVPMPSYDELTEYTALPSVVFPSDHVSLCADLKWNVTSD